VKIRCLVDKDGNPQKIVAAECDPPDVIDIFGPAAVAAVKKWRFSPGEIGGDPVPTRVAFNLFFELDS
jgi:outer membrane biosynthesis protein TonB